jgi:glyoxylase-like metal-dependent hydrolase (beta-lactamase superfamily II)
MKRIKYLMLASFIAGIVISLPLFMASLIAASPYTKNEVFNDIRIGDLWNDQARYVNEWYAIEAIDKNTYIIGEPRSSQYNSSYLIIGSDKAILLDAGSGERPKNIPNMREMAESLTDKPVTMMLSHFHMDHIGDLDKFEGVIMIDLPYLRSRIHDLNPKIGEPPSIHVSALETVIGAREIKILGWIKPNEYIDLGKREIQILNTPGHTFESLTIVDHVNEYVFTGDFMYQHLGGFVLFVPGSDLSVYLESVEALLTKTRKNYRFFGAHGLQQYKSDWIKQVYQELVKVRDDVVDLSMSETFMIPGLPLRLHQKEQILIYLPAYFDSAFLFSWRFIVMLAVVFTILATFFYSVFYYFLRLNLHHSMEL